MKKKIDISVLRDVKPELLGMNIKDGEFLVKHINNANIDIIIESGRARGFSTEIFAKCFPEKKIISIDFEKYSKNAKYSEKKLKKYSNILLRYGDSREIFNKKFFKQKAHVFIDGPKGHEAILLAAKLYPYENVRSISLDDFPQESFYSNIMELIFPGLIQSKSVNPDGRLVIIDKKTCNFNKKIFNNYCNWFDKIRPFYTKYTYTLKPGFIRNIMRLFT